MSRAGYYVNCTLSFNLAEVKISGNIHPLTGPRKPNVRTINTKDSPESKQRHLLDFELTQTMHDIIVLTETHLHGRIGVSEIFPNCYTVFRRDRVLHGRQGGSVLIAVISTLNVS